MSNMDKDKIDLPVSEVLKFVQECKSLAIISRSMPNLKERIIDITSFLDRLYKDTKHTKTGPVAFKDRLFFLRNNISNEDDIPRCQVCGGVCMYDTLRNTFRDFCNDKECRKVVVGGNISANYREGRINTALAHERRKKTNQRIYGTDTPAENVNVQAKMKATTMERHGVENYSSTGECREKVKKTVRERHGVDHVMQLDVTKEKVKETSRRRYGVDNPSQNDMVKAKTRKTMEVRFGGHPMQSDEIKQKVVDTNMERYGVIHPMQLDENRQAMSECQQQLRIERGDQIDAKREATNMERWGAPNPMLSERGKELVRQSHQREFGVDNYSSTPECREKVKQTMDDNFNNGHHSRTHISSESFGIMNNKDEFSRLYQLHGGVELAKILGINGHTVYAYLRKHCIDVNPTNSSAVENRLATFIESLLPPHPATPDQPRVLRNDRTLLNGKELDVYIPEFKLAIELNGIYWHSTKFKPADHMREKQAMCAARGVRLIHIYDDEYNDREIQFNRKLARLVGVRDDRRVYARKTEVVQLTNKQVKAFYDDCHIQGHMNAGTVYGLVIKGTEELVVAMSFKIQFGNMELTRYATSCNVVGGFTKLVKAFLVDNPDVDHLVSFADRRYSDGHMYESNGWVLDKITKPSYAYVVDGVRQHKAKFRRKYLREFLGDKFDPDKTEVQNMIDNDYPQIFDCGLNRYTLKRSTVLGS